MNLLIDKSNQVCYIDNTPDGARGMRRLGAVGARELEEEVTL